MRKRDILLFILAFAININLRAQEELGTHPAAHKTKPFIIPIIFYLPETNWGFGTAGIYVFHFLKDTDKTQPSSIQIGLAYTLRKQLLVYLPYQLHLQQLKYLLYGELGYYVYRYDFYGIGNNQPKNFMETYDVTYPRLRINILRNIQKKLYLGFRYWADNYVITSKNPTGELATENITGSYGGLSSGLGIIVNYDSRGNIFTPSSGTYIEAVAYSENRFTFSNYNFISSSFDVRKYIETLNGDVLALNLVSMFSSGNIPFYEMAMIGGQKNMRGFFQGRYRDKDEIVFQPEYRIQLFKRFGIVVFGGLGEITNNFAQFNTRYIRYSFGGGARYLFDKKQKINLRLDGGYAEGAVNYYFTIGEAF